MNYHHLKYFQVAAKEENYQRASEKLFITQSALSKAIAALESELGVSLFEKSGRNLRITNYGQIFLEYIDEGLMIIDAGINKVRFMIGELTGTIKLACIYSYTYGYLPELFREYNKLYPNISFSIHPNATIDVIDQVHKGDCDMGIHAETTYMRKFTDLHFYKIKQEEIVIIVPANHPLADRSSCKLADIADDLFVGFDVDSGILYKTRSIFAETDMTFTPFITVTDDQSVVNMVKGSMVTAFVLRNIAESNTGFSILTIEDDVDNYLSIYLTIKCKKNYSATVKTFFDFILQLENVQ